MSGARKQPPNGSRLQVQEETLYPYRDVQLVNKSIGFNQRLRIVEPLPLTSRARPALNARWPR
jgi:hypothetical protein